MSTHQRSFVGCAFDPRFGSEWVDGRITFERFQLRFVAQLSPDSAQPSPPAHPSPLEIPLIRLAIELDKSAGGQVFFRDPNNPDICIYTFDSGVIEDPALLQQTHTREQIQAIKSFGELKRRLKLTAFVLGGFGLAALLVSLVFGFMVRSLVAHIPPEFQKEIGDEALADLKEHVTFVQDPKLMQKLTAAAQPLVSVLPRTGTPLKFHIIDEPLPNALALPGGHLLVTTRLLDMADRPEEITAVLAHEIAHVRLKHHFRQLLSSAGPYFVFSVFLRGGGGLAGALGNSSSLLIRQSYSQEYELEADATGWDYLVSAGIDPRVMVEVLKKLDDEQNRHVRFNTSFGAFSSHPATLKRVERLDKKWRKLRDKTHFEGSRKSD